MESAEQRLLHVLLSLLAILVVSRIVGALFRRLQQPPVIGEVVAGLLLGPSLFGRVAPGAWAYVLPQAVLPYLEVIAQIGVVLFMFHVGLELDPGRLKSHTRATVAISNVSVIVPFVLGSALSVWLYPRFAPPGVPFVGFTAFLGVSMSVTAFPVLARILTDRGIHRTRLGTLAMACAAVDDVTAWCLLAVVVGVVRASFGRAALTVALAAAYVVFALWVLRPLVSRLVSAVDARGLTPTLMTVAYAAVLASSLITASIGIHAVFGAFLMGAIVPHDSRVARELRAQMETIVLVLLLPVFFAITGMRTQLGLLGSGSEWLACAVITLVASFGKFAGSAVAARVTGLAWREAATLGSLMNTRGLMELIVLTVGLELGVLSPILFTMFVLMALVTTLAAAPVVEALMGARLRAEAGVPSAAQSRSAA